MELIVVSECFLFSVLLKFIGLFCVLGFGFRVVFCNICIGYLENIILLIYVEFLNVDMFYFILKNYFFIRKVFKYGELFSF